MKLIVVGGVAGGATAAARARRLDESADIVMFERGAHISFANCGLPYYVGGVIRERDELLVTSREKFQAEFNVDVRLFSEVVEIDRAKKEVVVREVQSGKTYRESYDKLILSQGAAPVRPPVPGADLDNVFTLRSIPDADAIKNFIDEKKPARAVVVGGGFIGLEMMENLMHRGIQVTVIEMMDQVLAPLDPEMAALVQNYVRQSGVTLYLGEGVESFTSTDGRTMVHTTRGRDVETDMILLSVGVRPENELARKAGLELGKRGGIKTDEGMHTSDPDIFAVGDSAEIQDFVLGTQVQIPLAGPANRQGRIAADNACGRKSAYRGSQGTSVVKIIDLAAGATGVCEKFLKAQGKKYLKTYVHPGSHASYYPGAMMMTLKLLFDPDGGRVLGAQAVGGDGVDKRLDVLATAIRAGMTVFDLEELELAYAPPFSSARDPVNVAGMVASNMLRGDVSALSWGELEEAKEGEFTLLDVRDKAEARLMGNAGEGVNIPLGSLREGLAGLDRDKKYAVYCASGRRSYLACRILAQHGIQAVNLSGGYKSFKEVKMSENFLQKEPPAKEEAGSPSAPPAAPVEVHLEANACGIQCPGPIMKLKTRMDELSPGQVLKITATDPGFKMDVGAWCDSTGNSLISVTSDKGVITALVRKGGVQEQAEGNPPPASRDGKTIIVFSNDLDKVMASFIIANGAASMGGRVTMFFTFWGLNVLRRQEPGPVKKDVIESMFGAMMPQGADQLTLSKMHMGGMGTAMMKYVMKNKNVEGLSALIKSAQQAGVRLVACTMTMDIMGIKREELIDGVEEGGVATYLSVADKAGLNLFI